MCRNALQARQTGERYVRAPLPSLDLGIDRHGFRGAGGGRSSHLGCHERWTTPVGSKRSAPLRSGLANATPRVRRRRRTATRARRRGRAMRRRRRRRRDVGHSLDGSYTGHESRQVDVWTVCQSVGASEIDSGLRRRRAALEHTGRPPLGPYPGTKAQYC